MKILKLLHCIHTLPQRRRPAKLAMSWKIKNNLIHTDVHDCQQTKAVEATTSNSNNHSAAHSTVFFLKFLLDHLQTLRFWQHRRQIRNWQLPWLEDSRLQDWAVAYMSSVFVRTCWLEQAGTGRRCGHCRLCHRLFISSRQRGTRQPEQICF